MTSTTADALPLPPPPSANTATGRLVSPQWARRLGLWVTIDGRDQMRWTSVLAGIVVVVAVVSAGLGRIPYTIPKPLHYFGIVSPTAGMTRGTVAIAQGQFALAFHYHPLSFLMPILLLAVVARVVLGVTGPNRWITVRFQPSRRVWIALAIALAADWAYQQAHAGFLIGTHLV